MHDANAIIQDLFAAFADIRYVALYANGDLVMQQRPGSTNTSAADTDRYEELFVNPALLTLARQRGNVDCGGLRFVIVAYGNFYQLVREVRGGHLSICLEKTSDITMLPERILRHLIQQHVSLIE